jgi:hypothetical protein
VSELLEAGAAAAASRAFGRDRALFRDDKHIQPAQWLRVAGKRAVGCCNQNAPQLLAVAGAHLNDARIEGARGAISAQNQFQPRSQVEIETAQGTG